MLVSLLLTLREGLEAALIVGIVFGYLRKIGQAQYGRVAWAGVLSAALLSAALAVEAKDLPGLVLQTQQTLHELERLIEGLERHWLVRKYIEQRQPNTRIPPSEVVP